MLCRKQDLEKYLELLEIEFICPDYATLSQILKQNFRKIPFENISKLHYRKNYGLVHLPDLNLYLQSNKDFNFGGTCYTINYFLYKLLRYLGYKVKLCAADMDRVNAHMVIVVIINDIEYLVDAGYAAPLFDPVSLNHANEQTIKYGMDEYVVCPRDRKKGTYVKMYRRNKLKDFYYLKPARRKISDFDLRIIESFSSESTFLNSLLLSKSRNDHFICIHNYHVITSYTNSFQLEIISSQENLIRLIEHKFGIPAFIITDALMEIRSYSDAWGTS